MKISVHVPTMLRATCGGAAQLDVSAATVREALEQLERMHPALYASVCDETGAVRRHVNLFVNHDFCRDRYGHQTLLAPGDVLTIMPAVSGG